MNALAQEGYSVTLGHGERGQDQGVLEREISNGITLHQFKHLQNSINPANDLLALWEIYNYLRNNSIDFIHTHQTKASILGRLAAKLAGVPVVIYGVHGSTFSGLGQPLKGVLLGLERFLASSTDAFVYVGEDLRDRFIEAGIGTKDRYHVIRSAMDLSSFFEAANMDQERRLEKRRELGVEEGEVAIGKVASLEPRKGHEYALDVIEKVKKENSNIKVLFIGEGWYREEIERTVRQKGLEDEVIFTGYRDDIAEVMGALDMFLFTSLREGLPQVLIQAVATELPLATFDVEGACEVVEDGINGYIIPSKDTEGLAERVISMLENLEEAREMGKRGQEKIGDQWDVEKMKRDTVELYDKLVRENDLK